MKQQKNGHKKSLTKFATILYPFDISSSNLNPSLKNSKLTDKKRKVIKSQSFNKLIHAVQQQYRNNNLLDTAQQAKKDGLYKKKSKSLKSLPHRTLSLSKTSSQPLQSQIIQAANPQLQSSSKQRTLSHFSTIQIQRSFHPKYTQKLTRGYDHLGKLKKTTKTKPTMFGNLTRIDGTVGEITKSQFNQAKKKLNSQLGKAFQPQSSNNLGKNDQMLNKQLQVQAQVQQVYKRNQKMLKRKHMTIISPNQIQKPKKPFRSSALQPSRKKSISKPVNESNFFQSSFKPGSQLIQKPEPQHNIHIPSVNKLVSSQTIEQQQDMETISCDKVYFIPKRLLFQYATTFKLERINFRSRQQDKFIIEVVVQAKDKIMLFRIYHKMLTPQQQKKLMLPCNDKQIQRQQLKTQFFQQLIQARKTSTTQLLSNYLLKSNSRNQIYRNSFQYNDLALINRQKNYAFNQMEEINQMAFLNVYATEKIINNKMSKDFYKKVIQYLDTYCNLEVSYLGPYLKEIDLSQANIFNQIARKKHSQMQQTFLQSLKLARVFYFVLRINTTFYIAKSVFLHDRIKYYILYQFSNLVRHSKTCIIQQQQRIKQSNLTYRKPNLVNYIFNKMKQMFNKKSGFNNHAQASLLTAWELCFGTINKAMGRRQVDGLFNVGLSNYRNDIKWVNPTYTFGQGLYDNNFFRIHNAFDCAILDEDKQQKKQKFLFKNNPNVFVQRRKYTLQYEYYIKKNFEFKIVYLHKNGTRIIKVILSCQFRKQQFLLLHIPPLPHYSPILRSFLSKQLCHRLITQSNKSYHPIFLTRPLFTMIKQKKYFISVFVPILTKSTQYKVRNYKKQYIYIYFQNRETRRRYQIRLTINQLVKEMKEYHRLCSDYRAYHKYLQLAYRFKYKLYTVTKELFIEKIKFFISKLYLMKKGIYSHFFFIPLQNLVSNASFKASSIIPLQQLKRQRQKSSMISRDSGQSLILGALSNFQYQIQQNQKHSESTIKSIRIKNFPVYQIYFKTIKKIFHGYYALITIYFVPIFDISEIKVYVTKIQKSFYIKVSKNISRGEYNNLVGSFIQFLKLKYLSNIIARQNQKLARKYKQFYSQMIKQASTPFISRTRKPKQIKMFNNKSPAYKSHTKPRPHKPFIISQLTQCILQKVFQSHRHHKYLIRISFPANGQYVGENDRKGIDQVVDINVFKQNSIVIYRYKSTARKLLSKKITHKYNVIQLEYQQRNKPFHILYQQIKYLIEQSDETTYGLLNIFRSYFCNQHLNKRATDHFVSIISINLLAGITKSIHNFSNLNGFSMAGFPTQKQLNLKEIHSNMYQRFCLFVCGNQMLQVLAKRKKSSTKIIPKLHSTSGQSSNLLPSSQKPLKKLRIPSLTLAKPLLSRKLTRKHSIDNLLPQPHTTFSPQVKIHHYQSSSHKLDDQINQSISQPQQQQKDQKIVYLINKDTQIVEEIQESQDRGFAVNVGFQKYNKRMFKRFFYTIQKVQQQQTNKTHSLQSLAQFQSQEQFKSSNHYDYDD